MAKLPALITALEKVDGRERATIEHVARVIREAGYIPTTKRGAGAAEMTAREAANLLIALNGADVPKDGPIAIDRFRSLKLFSLPSHWTDNTGKFLQNLAAKQDFGAALEFMIESAPEIVFYIADYLLKAYPDQSKKQFNGRFRSALFGQLIPILRVEMSRYSAKIYILTYLANGEHCELQIKFLVNEHLLETGFYGAGGSDRKVQVSFGMPTILAAHIALFPEFLSEIAGLIAGGGPS